MIKRIIIFIFLISIFCFPAYAANEISVSAEGAALIIAESGELIFGKNENKQLSMASTTKIMTSLLLLEENTPEKEITVTSAMTSVEGTSMGLLPGDKVTCEALVYGMLLESGNDAANTAAYVVSGSPAKFAELMNQKAKLIGMENTNFVTPSGLDAAEHYSTAYDMALLGAYAVSNPEFAKICSTNSISLEYGNPPYRRRLSNHNRLLTMYDGAFGIKTGFTKKSGRCLVSAAERNGVTLIAVTLNAPDDWNDHTKMFDYGFSVVDNQELKTDTSNLTVPIIGGDKTCVSVSLGEECHYPVLKGESMSVKSEILLKNFIYAPVKEGQTVGEVRYYSADGKQIASQTLVAGESSECTTQEVRKETKKKGLFKRIADFFKKLFNR